MQSKIVVEIHVRMFANILRILEVIQEYELSLHI